MNKLKKTKGERCLQHPSPANDLSKKLKLTI
jgi:hypothetical protein